MRSVSSVRPAAIDVVGVEGERVAVRARYRDRCTAVLVAKLEPRCLKRCVRQFSVGGVRVGRPGRANRRHPTMDEERAVGEEEILRRLRLVEHREHAEVAPAGAARSRSVAPDMAETRPRGRHRRCAGRRPRSGSGMRTLATLRAPPADVRPRRTYRAGARGASSAQASTRIRASTAARLSFASMPPSSVAITPPQAFANRTIAASSSARRSSGEFEGGEFQAEAGDEGIAASRSIARMDRKRGGVSSRPSIGEIAAALSERQAAQLRPPFQDALDALRVVDVALKKGELGLVELHDIGNCDCFGDRRPRRVKVRPDGGAQVYIEDNVTPRDLRQLRRLDRGGPAFHGQCD